jgi:hypothetical protein
MSRNRARSILLAFKLTLTKHYKDDDNTSQEKPKMTLKKRKKNPMTYHFMPSSKGHCGLNVFGTARTCGTARGFT